MDLLSSLTLYGLITVFFFGQLFRLSIYGFEFPVIDIFIGLAALMAVTRNNQPFKNHYFLWFLIYSWLLLLISSFLYKFNILTPAFYLLRLTSILILLSEDTALPGLAPKHRKFFDLILFSGVLFGFIQYFFWPDLTYFKSIGWDDHLYRLVGTFLDPTFTGLIFLLFMLSLIYQKNKNWLIIGLTYIAMALTYSRSTLLSFWIVGLFAAFKLKKINYALICTLLVAAAILLLPRQPGEGTKLERTSSVSAKIINYREGMALFAKSPVFGFGYNNLVNLRPKTAKTLHSQSGFDSSLLTILTTTGLIGAALFILGFYKIFRSADISKQSMLVAIFVHSLFANSLLYPWTLVCFLLL